MPDAPYFISYSSVDAQNFAIQLTDLLESGPPSFKVWLDKRELQAGRDWDDQLADAIRNCAGLLFVMTPDSVTSNSVCKKEWTRALKYKKLIIPLLVHPDAEMPFSLEPRQYIDFTRNFDRALAQLRRELSQLDTPKGQLRALRDRLADAERDLRRAADEQEKTRIQEDIDQLKQQIAEQERVVANPQAARQQTERSVKAGMERERQPQHPPTGSSRTKFINPPPGIAPGYFQDRHTETRMVGDFLNNEAQRLITVVGRGGVGKTAMVCRLLKALESGKLPDDGGELYVDGIVYLSARGTRPVNLPTIFADLGKLLPDQVAEELDALYKDPHTTTEKKMATLLGYFPGGRTALLLDNFEDVVDSDTLNIADAELAEALRALLCLPHHGVKVIITTRVAPQTLLRTQPGRQMRIDLDEGLPHPYAENILRAMDVDGKVGLKNAGDALLAEARERTRGYPRALEALFAILSADRSTTLREILNDIANTGENDVVEALVGEAFSRLDTQAQQVMEALAIYGRPVPSTAIDYLLQPYSPTINSAPILRRLVNMQFVRREAERFYLHPVDRDYALSRIPEGHKGDRDDPSNPFTQFALFDRAADFFRETRTPRETWKTLEDLQPQLAEFELRYAGQDYDAAADVLTDIDFDYLLLWGYARLVKELHERIRDKVSDPYLKGAHLNNLGSAYYSLGDARQAIGYYEQHLAIAREIGDRRGEGAALGNLGSAYYSLGEARQAIGYYEQRLAIAREIGDRQGEGSVLGNLGVAYAALGDARKAIGYYEQALVIDREIGDRRGEAQDLENFATVLIDEGQDEEAIRLVLESIEIGEEIGSPLVGSWSNGVLALAHVSAGNLPAARTAAQVGQKYDWPEHNHYVAALLGLIALRQGDQAAAQEAFGAAVRHADQLLKNNLQSYAALDSKGLALCGLALLRGEQHVMAAHKAYRAARQITTAPGVVAQALRLFDALAVLDAAGVLKDVRPIAINEAR